jgi:hypothetical protein
MHIDASIILIFEYSVESNSIADSKANMSNGDAHSKADTVIGEATGRYNSPHLLEHYS